MAAWRQELTTYFRSLPQTEAAALDAARSGWPFGELCALLCEELGEAQAPLQAASHAARLGRRRPHHQGGLTRGSGAAGPCAQPTAAGAPQRTIAASTSCRKAH